MLGALAGALAGALLTSPAALLTWRALQRAKAALEHERENRRSERQGRIRFEQELRRLQLETAAKQATQRAGSAGGGNSGSSSAGDGAAVGGGGGGGGGAFESFPFKPIGYLHSVFSQRNGTPRQPLLVPLARSRLQLAPDVHASSLEGLEQYSHCWVIYVFHENTDLVKTLQGDRSGRHSKIAVPRLNGAKMGVLATRSPHRPVPIGLSTARVLEVSGGSVILGGADIVDGSPVLDIKPYVPFCDAPPGASAPPWVAACAADEPLAVAAVALAPGAADALARCWAGHRGRSLYRSGEEFVELVKQVLSRDIRSLHKRLGQDRQDLYHVILEGVDVTYTVGAGGGVLVVGAELGGTGGRVMMARERAPAMSAAATQGQVGVSSNKGDDS